jgi:hypothetical protein
MAVFLDSPRRDEALFSLVSQYGDSMCVQRWPAFLITLFGYRASLCPCIAFNLDHVAFQTRDSLGMSGVDVANRLTAYPYLTKFGTRADSLRLLGEMLVLFPGLKSRATLQLLRSRPYLRYCRRCWDQDRLAGHLPYWRRSHQLPGVVTCHEHHSFLYERYVPDGRSAPWPLAEVNSGDKRIDFALSDDSRRNVDAVSVRSASLLTIADATIETSNERLREMARDCGFGRGNWSVAADEILCDLTQFFGAAYLDAVGCSAHSTTENWVAGRLGLRRSSLATLPYVLLDVFLADRVRGQGASQRVLCRNAFAPHDPPHVVDYIARRRGRYFALCQCGFGFTFLNSSCVRSNDIQVHQVGFYFADEARKLHSSGVSLRAIAKELEVSASTVRRLVNGQYGGPDCVSIEAGRARLGQEWRVLVWQTGGAKAASKANTCLVIALTRFVPEQLAGGRGVRGQFRDEGV